MPWININPASEPSSSVRIVAQTFFIDESKVTPTEMAYYYNRYLNPTLLNLEPSSEPAPRYGDKQDKEILHDYNTFDAQL